MHELKDFAIIIDYIVICYIEVTLILRKSKHIFTAKRYNSTKIKQDNSLAWIAWKHLLFSEIFSVFSGKKDACCVFRLENLENTREFLTKDVLSRKFYARRNYSKVDSIETRRIVIAHLLS